MGFGFDLFGIMFGLSFVLILGMFVLIMFRVFLDWNANNHSPRLTVPVTVVAKRCRDHRGGDHHYSTSYFVTFQVESGDRMELHLTGQQYGLIVEGDRGLLTFQGTRFLNFERQF